MGQFKHVRTGITCVYIGLWLTVAAILTIPTALLLNAAPLILAAPLLFACASLLSMVGRILCLSVPNDVGATWLIYAAVGCDVAALLATASGMVPGMPDFSGFNTLISMVGIVLFLLFLKQLAVFIRASESVARASNLLNLAVGLVVVVVIALFLPLMGLVALLLGLIGFFLYSGLLAGLKQRLRAA